MPKPAPSILVVAHNAALLRRLLRDLRILGFPATGVSRLGIAALVLKLRGFDLILAESAAYTDAVGHPLSLSGDDAFLTTPRLWIGDSGSLDELDPRINRAQLDHRITQTLSQRSSGSFLPGRPSKALAVRQLLSLLDRTGIETQDSARLAGRRAGMVAATYGLGRNACQLAALSTMLRRIGLLCIQSGCIDTELVDPVWAAREVLNAIPPLLPIRDPVLCYRERWDGTGRPNGWAGEEIPVLARIIAVVDGYQMSLSAGRTHARTIARLSACAGQLYEPAAVDALTDAARHAEWSREPNAWRPSRRRASVA